jgi:hypothetical protein
VAHIDDEFCVKHKRVTTHVNGKCSLCQQEKEEKALKEWEARPLDEKLLNLHMRLKKIEENPTDF